MLDLRVVLRRFTRRPWPILSLVLVIALAVGTNTAVFSQVNDVLFAELPYPAPDRLVRIWAGTGNDTPGSVLPLDYLALRDARGGVLTQVAAYRPVDLHLGAPMHTEVAGAQITASLLDVLGVVPRCTSRIALEDLASTGTPVVLLEEGYARERFGTFACGASLYLDVDGRNHLVAGLLTDIPVLPEQRAQVFVLFEPDERQTRSAGTFGLAVRPVFVAGRLAPRVSVQTATQVLRETVALRGERAVRVIAMREHLTQRVRDSTLLLQVLAAFVLIVTMINASQALTSEASSRAAESGVRVALGASAWRAHRSVLVESTLLAAAGAIAAGGVYAITSALLDVYGPASGLRGFAPGPRGPVIAVAGSATLLLALVPAIPLLVRTASRSSGPQGWKAGGSERVGISPWELRVAQVLLIGQVAVMTAGVAVGLLLLKSTRNLLAVDLGFDASSVRAVAAGASATTPEERVADLLLVMQALGQQSALRAAVASALPMGAATSIRVTLPGRASESVLAHRVYASAGFFEVLGIAITEGRPFRVTDDRGAEPIAIVSGAFARRFLDRHALGRQIMFGAESWTVVGVAGDVRTRGAREADVPTVYVHLPQATRGASVDRANVLRRSELILRPSDGTPPPDDEKLRAIVARASLRVSLAGSRPMAAAVSRDTQPTRFLAGVAVVFAVLTLLLGMLATSVAAHQHLALRRTEVAVRIALGASPSEARRTIARTSVLSTAIGILASLPLSYVSASLLRAHLFGVDPSSPFPYALAATGVIASCLTALARPVYRAGRVNAAEALRSL